MKSSKVSLSFRKNGFALVNKIWHSQALKKYSMAQESQFSILKDCKYKEINKLQYKKKVFEEFQGFSSFLRKIALYARIKSDILKPLTNIQWSRRFGFGIWLTLNKLIGNCNIREKLLKSFVVCLAFHERCFSIYQQNSHSEDFNEYSEAQKIPFRLFNRLQSKFIGNHNKNRESLKISKVCFGFTGNWFVFCWQYLAF